MGGVSGFLYSWFAGPIRLNRTPESSPDASGALHLCWPPAARLHEINGPGWPADLSLATPGLGRAAQNWPLGLRPTWARAVMANL